MTTKFLFPCLFLIFIFNVIGLAKATLTVTDLKCEYKTNPVAIDAARPRLSWKITSDRRGVLQTAYEIRAAVKTGDLDSGKNLLWDSGKVNSDRSIHIPYQGPAIESRQRVYWQVKIWDNNGAESGWSEPAFWEMGLLKPADWRAGWITPDLKTDSSKSGACPMLRKEFSIEKDFLSARAYITCLGLYEAEINGKRVGDEVLTPGWTAYDERLQYQTYDITDRLQKGKNAVGVTLGEGWFLGRLAWERNRNIYGDKLGLLLQIEITCIDGSKQTVTSDVSWTSAWSPILMSSIYDGETYDARLEKPGWSSADFDDSGWSGVKEFEHDKKTLIAPAGPPVLKMEELSPVAVLKTPSEETVLDMGQNMVGWMRFKVKGPAGATVTLQHAEVLDKEGNFYTENLRSAKQEIYYTLKGTGEEIFEPHFTFQGFRFVSVKNWPGELRTEDFTGVAVYSAITPTGTFECSNDTINQLQHNIQWGQKGNFVDVPTDCPQRDERLGWTGDAQAFARTACFNADVAAFYTKWLADVAADQQSDGAVPHVIPNVLSHGRDRGASASAGWADAAVFVPWTVYLCYGDTRILEHQYASMKAWVDYMANKAGDTYFWNTDFTFGDWLSFNTDRSDYPGAFTAKDLICQAHFCRSTDLVLQTAKILGKNDDVQKYSELLKKAKKVFNDEFVTPNGRISSNTQTAYALALAYGLLPEDQRKQAAKRLADDVNQFKHITTGFLGTPLICHVLGEYGFYDEAYMLLNNKGYPSWLYPVTQGATTIWERWDGQKPDGSFQDAGMNSFNHYAYGAIGDWLYRVVAGIEIDESNPGYKHIIIQPHP
ncbi:family 78 glycoside hydrolase catalytic domain, partial [candidate division KSB1 bacterium]|nr:family 78 glycoside hydrolase catalytic domain [candidate division KSB1 bacterium]